MRRKMFLLLLLTPLLGGSMPPNNTRPSCQFAKEDLARAKEELDGRTRALAECLLAANNNHVVCLNVLTGWRQATEQYQAAKQHMAYQCKAARSPDHLSR